MITRFNEFINENVQTEDEVKNDLEYLNLDTEDEEKEALEILHEIFNKDKTKYLNIIDIFKFQNKFDETSDDDKRNHFYYLKFLKKVNSEHINNIRNDWSFVEKKKDL